MRSIARRTNEQPDTDWEMIGNPNPGGAGVPCAGCLLAPLTAWTGGPLALLTAWTGGPLAPLTAWTGGPLALLTAWTGGPLALLTAWTGGDGPDAPGPPVPRKGDACVAPSCTG
jgi:hypothetical protein